MRADQLALLLSWFDKHFLARQGAARVTQDPLADPQLGRRGTPTAVQPIAQQRVRARSTRPHGDRRDGTESVRIKAEKDGREWQDDVVGEFVLRDDLADHDPRSLASRPCEEIRERETIRECSSDLADNRFRIRLRGTNTNDSHAEPYAFIRTEVSWADQASATALRERYRDGSQRRRSLRKCVDTMTDQCQAIPRDTQPLDSMVICALGQQRRQ